MIREKLKNLVRETLEQLAVDAGDVRLEHPADFSLGDFSTNAAMAGGKRTGRDPKELAEEIVAELNKKKDEDIEKIEVAGPGFINFRLSQKFFAGQVAEVLKKRDDFGKNDLLAGKKIMVEYTDPNPFKEMHIGHLVPNAIGESLSRIIAFSGARMERANYQGDVGLHVAKAIWHFLNAEKDITSEKDLDGLALGVDYAAGTRAYEENDANKAAIEEVNRKIYDGSDAGVNEVYQRGRARSLELFEELYERLGTKFDHYFFESETGPVGKGIVESHPEVFAESDGAIVFRGEEHGLHTRVFINSDGLPTYEAKELGLLKKKAGEFPFDVSIAVVGNEIKEYARVVKRAAELSLPELGSKMLFVTNGMLRLPSGKMSSRTGEVISAESVLDAVAERLAPKLQEARIANADELKDPVAVGAVKYSILKQRTGRDIIFDFDKSLSFEGDSGPYLQYTHARARSVLEKARGLGMEADVSFRRDVGIVEKLLCRFPEVVERAAKEYEPHYITTYVTELAGAFNSFYAQERIVDAGDKAPYRIALTDAVAVTIKNGLYLLGIAAPEKM
ncbi:MAG: arginine--tRNA ligase [Parcubacteria group bacterium]|nr:arginine--tRNA ligase [Parcubacteria group bacterium]